MKDVNVSAVLLSVGLATKVILSNAAGVSCKLLLKVNPCRGRSDPLFKIERYRKIRSFTKIRASVYGSDPGFGKWAFAHGTACCGLLVGVWKTGKKRAGCV